MNIKDEDMEWKKEAPQLASLPKNMPYSVPDNYFNELQARINQSVFVDGLVQKENQGFTVPSHYFEELGNQIESRIATEELKSLVNNDGFKTPTNYFDTLQANIISKTTSASKKTKVVRLWGSNLVRYASAACFVVITASVLYLNQQRKITQQTALIELANEQVLYDIDETTILEHIKESQTATSTASDAEMEKYILDNFSSTDLSNNL